MTLLNALKTILLLTVTLYAAPFFIESIKKQYNTLLEPQAHIGMLSITKPVHNAADFIEQLHSFFKDPIIRGIVIKIDCAEITPGTSQTIFHDIRQLKKEYPKPIIALVENICLSGAYLVASACDYIIAPESSLIGDIGKSFCSWSLKSATESDELFDALYNEAYQQLIKQIALSRKLSLTTITNWASGKIFTGSQAITIGLINEIGSLCNVIKIIKEKALIEGEIEWVEPDKQNQSLYNTFFGNERTIA